MTLCPLCELNCLRWRVERENRELASMGKVGSAVTLEFGPGDRVTLYKAPIGVFISGLNRADRLKLQLGTWKRMPDVCECERS